MDSEGSDNYEDLYDDKDALKHDKLVEKVLSLNKTQHLKKPSRTEPTLQISEFNLVKSVTGGKDSVRINDLTKVLKNRRSHVKISKSVQKANKKSHTLPKPLEKPQAERIRRSVAYEKSRLELDRWEPIVTSNRVSTNLSFPLDQDVKMDKKESENFSSMWRVKSKLEQELEEIEPKIEVHQIDLEQEKFPFTMEEMLARRKEAAKLRAFQGYKEAKARRQNKIKSKKYHRIQKREKIKQKLKEFEQLQKTNPELALQKLEEIEKTRIEERFSLRHKSTGKWAKSKQIRAKYDKESRQVLAEQLRLSRDLTHKTKQTNDSESDEENQVQVNPSVSMDENNPWVNGIKPGKEVADFISGYRKFWMDKNKSNEDKEVEKEETKKDIENKPQKESEIEIVNDEKSDGEAVKTIKEKRKRKRIKSESKSTSEWAVSTVENGTSIEDIFEKAEKKLQKKMLKNVKKLKKKLKIGPPSLEEPEEEEETKKVDLSLPLQVKKPIIDDELLQDVGGEDLEEINIDRNLSSLKNILSSEPVQKEANIDPQKYLKVKTTNLSTAIPDILTTEENEESVAQREIISEAFEDDDIVQEFDKEKNDEIEKNKPKDIDLNLPGWGSWGGANIPIPKRKKRRFIVKAPPEMPRRDDNKGTLIVNENAQNKIKEHMVSEVPFPFKTVKDFEASIRAPIGNTFVPETAYRRLIKPALTTKMGTIIEPMSKDLLLNKKNR